MKNSANGNTKRKTNAPNRNGAANQPANQMRSAGNVVPKRRRQHKKIPLFGNTDVIPFVLLAVSLLLETCLILNSHTGAVGSFVHDLFYALIGPISHVLAIGALVFAFFYDELKRCNILKFKAIICGVFVFVLAATYTLVAQNGMAEASFSFPWFIESGIISESGGIFGCIFAFIFSVILTPAASATVLTVSSLVLFTFCLGKTHIGIWKAFFKYDNPSPKKSDRSAEKAPSAPNVSPTAQRIDTVIAETPSAPAVDLGSAAQNVTYIDDLEAIALNNTDVSDDDENEDDIFLGSVSTPAADSAPPVFPQKPHAEGFDVLGFDMANGTHSVEEVDFGEERNLRKNYRPLDLMTDFGISSESNDTQDDIDIYDETPTPTPTKVYKAPEKMPVTSVDNGSSVAYSPFADPVRSMNGGKGAPTGSKAASKTVVAEPKAAAYSPFSDPVRSMNTPTKRSSDAAPQLYIATDTADKWEDAHRQQQPEIAVPAPEQIISAPAQTDDEDIDLMPFAPTLPKRNAAPRTANATSTSAFGVASNGALTEEDEQQIAPARTPAFAPAEPVKPVKVVKAEPVVVEKVAEPEQIKPAKPDIKAISALNGNTQIIDEVKAPEMAQTSDVEPEEEYEEEQRGINFYTYKHKRYPNYVPPTIDLLDPPSPPNTMSEQEIFEVQSKLLEKLSNFKIEATLQGFSIGPSITRYEIMPGPGVKVKQITALSEDIGLALQSEVRIVTVPGKAVIGVEVPNRKVSKVSLRSLIENPEFKGAKSKITVCIGLTVSGKPIYMNIDDMPHVLVAGQTKSGKSVAINCMLISLIYRASPDEVQFILIDPKRVELSIYSDLPHMVMPVIDDPKRAAAALKWAVAEMERRYQLLSDMQVRNRDEYYALKDENPNFEYMPQIVIIIDELADLMLQVREHVEELINRLAAMARACGMHLIIGTQRPSVDIVTGLIKANIPSRVSFKVANPTDSRIILGNVGAEKLLGRGDMLYYPTGSNQIRAQGAFVDTPEIKRILKFIMDKNGGPQFNPEIMYTLQTETDKLNKSGASAKKSDEEADDVAIDSSDIDFDYICKATELVINLGKATTNVIQRHLKVGFNKAANITDQLEELGFISKSQGSSRPREVLITMQQFLEWKNQNQK